MAQPCASGAALQIPEHSNHCAVISRLKAMNAENIEGQSTGLHFPLSSASRGILSFSVSDWKMHSSWGHQICGYSPIKSCLSRLPQLSTRQEGQEPIHGRRRVLSSIPTSTQ